jgi:hypothetical protein
MKKYFDRNVLVCLKAIVRYGALKCLDKASPLCPYLGKFSKIV